AQEILKTAKQQKVDLVLMGSKGITGLRRLLMGSVAQTVSQHAPCSVLKTRPDRIAGVRKEVHARDDQPVVIREFLKPGVDEWCSVLPPRWASRFRRTVEKLGLTERLSVGLHVKTSSISGFMMMRGLAKLRRWRRSTSRYIEEQARIEQWLVALIALLPADREVALEVAQCPTLLKGYGETHRRGIHNFEQIMGAVDHCRGFERGPQAVAELRAAALADPDGDTLDKVLASVRQVAT
ncbi:MAG: universal stress protein, partial [Gammaproteobacteria bacterium]|nr:universal stress protein [Gammaproteobacteria bacterium]